jgi:polar amino acid transport system substrate-binding protein
VIAPFRQPLREHGPRPEFTSFSFSWRLPGRRCPLWQWGFGAQTQEPSDARELVIGTKVAAPFAIKEEDGTWHGISIELWRRIADQMHLRYRFEETSLNGLIAGVADGSLDAAVAALTVTGPRHQLVDFTQPFYSTGLGIAVIRDASMNWWPIIINVFSVPFLLAVATLYAVSVWSSG